MGNRHKCLICAMAALPLISFAQQAPGVWFGGRSEGATYASVTNDAGNALSKMCFNGTCAWILYLDLRCEEDHQQPALASGRPGAAHITFTCLGKVKNRQDVYMLSTDSADIDTIAKSGGIAGFAVPLDDGKFSIYRFNVDGAASSLKALESATQERAPEKKPASIGKSIL